MVSDLVRFIGGGRWATTVLTELTQTFPNLRIDWVCNSVTKEKQKIVKNLIAFENVSLVDKAHIFELSQPDKVIIASHSSQHCSDLLTLQNSAITLVEKPLYPHIYDFEALSSERKNSTFINLEFYNAFFISDFAKEISSFDVKSIKFIWHDPLEELRQSGERKNSEIYSSIFMDQLMHVMSISKRMGFDSSASKETKLDIKKQPNGIVRIFSTFHDVKIEISLSRFAEKRERKINVNNREILLDFSSKPIIKKSKCQQNEIHALKRPFPISQTLVKFINYPDQSDISSLSLESLMPEIKFCFDCENLFIESFSDESCLYSPAKGEVEPNLVYYAGIQYYQALLSLDVPLNIHYLKGFEGVKELLNWWYDYCNRPVN